MDSCIINEICEGNLEELKKIPKIKITETLSKKMISIMEEKIENLQDNIKSNYESSGLDVSTYHYSVKKEKIEECILYLKKIR